MSLLDEIGVFLASEGHGTLGVDLFLSLLPDAPDSCVAVYEMPGQGPVYVAGDVALPAWERVQLQVVARAASYPAARTKIGNVWRSLQKIGNEALSGTTYLAVQAVDSPAPLGRDHQQRELLAAHFTAWRVPPSTE